MAEKESKYEQKDPGTQPEGQTLIGSTNLDITQQIHGINGILTVLYFSDKLVLTLATDGGDYLSGEHFVSDDCSKDEIADYFDRIKKGDLKYIETKTSPPKKWITSLVNVTQLRPQQLDKTDRLIKDLTGQIKALKNEVKMLQDVTILQETKATNNHAGNATAGAWGKRPLNSVQYQGLDVKLASDGGFTLPKGNYIIRATTATGWCNHSQSRIADSTGKELILGINAYWTLGGQGTLAGGIKLTDLTTLYLEQRVSTNPGTHGHGHYNNFGNLEVYATVEINKVG